MTKLKPAKLKKPAKKKITEINDILKVIDRYVEDHKGDVAFYGAFVTFDPSNDYEIKDDRLICFGDKEVIDISMKDLKLIMKKEADKDGFINF